MPCSIPVGALEEKKPAAMVALISNLVDGHPEFNPKSLISSISAFYEGPDGNNVDALHFTRSSYDSKRNWANFYSFFRPRIDCYSGKVDERVWQVFLILGGVVPHINCPEVRNEIVMFINDGPHRAVRNVLSKKAVTSMKSAVSRSRNGYRLLLPLFLFLFEIMKTRKIRYLTKIERHYDTEKIAHIVRTIDSIYDAWNKMACSRGYNTIEEMVAPYLRFNINICWYCLLSDHTFSINSTTHSVLNSHSTTSNPSESGYGIEERSGAEHALIRNIAGVFIDSVKSLAVKCCDATLEIEVTQELQSKIRDLELELNKTTIIVGTSMHLNIATKDYPIHTTVPAHIMIFLSERLNISPKEAIQLSHVPVSSWKAETLFLLHKCEDLLRSKFMLKNDANKYNLFIAPSSIEGAGQGVFAQELIPAGAVVGTFPGTIVRSDIEQRTNISSKTCFGIPGLEMSYHRFSRYCWRYPFDKAAYIVPDPYCVAAMVNDPRNSEYKANVYPDWAPGLRYEDLSSHSSLTYRTLLPILPYDELFIDYGDAYLL